MHRKPCVVVLPIACLVLTTFSGCASGEKVITKEETYPDGSIKSRISYHIKNGEEVLWGEATYYYPSGLVEIKCEHGNGRKHGKYEEFYESGAPKSAGRFAYGKRDGVWSEWDEDGNETRRHFQNGEEVKAP